MCLNAVFFSQREIGVFPTLELGQERAGTNKGSSYASRCLYELFWAAVVAALVIPLEVDMDEQNRT